jgi:dolichol-phosphate mannosyltransferase
VGLKEKKYAYDVAVVIPSYKVTRHIMDVLATIGPECQRIFVVDDACPDNSGKFVFERTQDPRVSVLFHEQNQGVGGAVMTGYAAAVADGAQVIVKIDGDGQMDPQLLDIFVQPILRGEADYTKGNRFYNLESLRSMPAMRLLGNAILSFLSKISTGYWGLFDPTNGYTAIHAAVARHLPVEKISKRYFFETDVLFRLNTLRACIVDVPMEAIYADETSHLKISKIITEFFYKHLRNTIKRIFYNYYLRDMSLASLELPLGLVMILFGVGYGGYHWYQSLQANMVTPAGTVVLSAISLVMGLQLLLAFIGFDIANVPAKPIHHSLRR